MSGNHVIVEGGFPADYRYQEDSRARTKDVKISGGDNFLTEMKKF